MDEFGILSRDFGLRPQGKAVPMSASKRATVGSAPGLGSDPFPGDLFGGDQRGTRRPLAVGDGIFFGDAPPKYASASSSSFASDPFFSMGSAAKGGSSAAESGFSSSVPVYDKPVYDDDDGDIFSGVPGVKKSSSNAAGLGGDVFAPPAYEDDLLASLGGSQPASSGAGENGRPAAAYGSSSPPYDEGDLLAGFGRSEGRKMPEAAPARSSPPYGDDEFLSSLGGGRSDGDDKRSGGASLKQSPPSYEDDLLAGLGVASKHSKDDSKSHEGVISDFSELIPGFGRSSVHQQSGISESKHQQPSASSSRSTVAIPEDPFVVFESRPVATDSFSGFTDPLEQLGKPSGSMRSDVSSAKVGKHFDALGGFDGFTERVPSFLSGAEDMMDKSPPQSVGNVSSREPLTKPTDSAFSTTVLDDTADKNLFEKSTKSSETFKSVYEDGQQIDKKTDPYTASSRVNATKKHVDQPTTDDDIWLTVDEIPLFTEPTCAPPPSRAPPPSVFRAKQTPFGSQAEGSSVAFDARRWASESHFQQPAEGYQHQNSQMPKMPTVSSLDELEAFAMGNPQIHSNEARYVEEGNEANSTAAASAAAMRQAMDRAEAKFKHAREVREREGDWRSFKTREATEEAKDEDEKDKLDHEREQREREEKERRRLEKMRELELEREREKARQAVERATREARERAAAEARQKAEKAAREQAERAAFQRAQAEARERAAAEAKEKAEKLAAEREKAEAEARERAAAEARERADRERAAMEAREKAERAAVERAAAEARARAQRVAVERATAEARERAAAEAQRAAVEKATAEARERAAAEAQRAAVERATAEARERAAAEARERAAFLAREKQKKENDLDSFFGMGARANSAPKERSTPSGSGFDNLFQGKGSANGNQRTAATSSNMRRPSSTTNIIDDLTSVFRTSSYDEFQEIEGEPEERRRARLERERRARERAAKALAEKNEREMQMQREQAERDRLSDTLNVEIRRWAAGKEGNLRALLSTLQYVLWPESGWQPVSLTDLITGASVKKVYRKATLCVHPDKVVNGTVQQKYVAEKVFDLLKEAWNKFNSEELF